MWRVAVLLLVLALCVSAAQSAARSASAERIASRHTNNWAVIVDTSRFWFNYRHAANALGVYRTVKRLGIPDSQIILMLADDVACNPRNPYAGCVFNRRDHQLDLYGEEVEVDYRGYDVTAENFVRVLTGRHHPHTPRSQRLLTDDSSNVLVYMTGHGGDEFLKFQDAEELTAAELADAFEQMWQKRRYNEIFFMIDTCQADTMLKRLYSPNILGVGSSGKGENSYSHHGDELLGVPVIDRFTYHLLEFCEQHMTTHSSNANVMELFESLTPSKLLSRIGYGSSLRRPLKDVQIAEFFGSAIEVTASGPSARGARSSVRQIEF